MYRDSKSETRETDVEKQVRMQKSNPEIFSHSQGDIAMPLDRSSPSPYHPSKWLGSLRIWPHQLQDEWLYVHIIGITINVTLALGVWADPCVSGLPHAQHHHWMIRSSTWQILGAVAANLAAFLHCYNSRNMHGARELEITSRYFESFELRITLLEVKIDLIEEETELRKKTVKHREGNLPQEMPEYTARRAKDLLSTAELLKERAKLLEEWAELLEAMADHEKAELLGKLFKATMKVLGGRSKHLEDVTNY